MRSPGPVVAAALLLLGAAGCTDDGAETGAGAGADAAGSPSSNSPSSSTPPAPTSPSAPAAGPGDLAGTAEAEALGSLPAGPASGTAVLVYSGLGELRAPFTGQCSSEGSTTRIEGSADTARIVLTVTPGGARIALDDDGLTATSDLATGRYEVAGSHLSLSADMSQDGQPAGSAELEIDCGG
ncbi:hypothetical protein [Blastococcus sp. SYSU DS0617]